jgi:hypothetical protein
MPNWVSNTLRIIKGDPQEVFAFVRTEHSVFDFNTLVRMPEHVKSSTEEVALVSFAVPVWYAWAVENWGTKWNARDAKYSTKHPECVIWFDTAWSAPVAVFESLAKHFPEHEIVIDSDEYDNHFHVTFTLTNGQVVWATDPCSCFDGDTPPLSSQEMDAFGIEEAPGRGSRDYQNPCTRLSG